MGAPACGRGYVVALGRFFSCGVYVETVARPEDYGTIVLH